MNTTKKVLIAALLPLTLIACGDNGTDTTTTTVVDQSIIESSDVSATGVLLAAVLLVDGDVEQALADARVTVAEVDAAATAIENDTLDRWAALAED